MGNMGNMVTYEVNVPEWPKNSSRSMLRSKATLALMDASWKAYYEWRALAATRLSSSREEYLRGMRPPSVSLTGASSIQVEFGLEGWLPVAVEKGSPAFDMKSSLVKSGTGRRVIPFKDKALKGKGYSYWDIHKDMPSGAKNMWRMHSEDTNKFTESHAQFLAFSIGHQSHDANIKAKNQKAPKIKAASFRTMSTNSSSDSWLHPGIRKKDFYEEIHRKLVSEYLPQAFYRHLNIPITVRSR